MSHPFSQIGHVALITVLPTGCPEQEIAQVSAPSGNLSAARFRGAREKAVVVPESIELSEQP